MGVLEATMVVIDNSEFMRNGDYTPSRYEAQSDAVNLIFSAKTRSNPESAVGLMTMAGRAPEVLVTLTNDFGKILASMVQTKIHGTAHATTAIQVAALALKHRQNKAQRQRVIVFVGSPVLDDEKELVKLAKKMKKNNIAVDFINFGEDAENVDKLEKFISNVKSGDNSHLLNIPAGPQLLSDVIVTSQILADEDGMPQVSGAGAGGAGAGVDNFEFGVDPNLDPELALALRMSLEEERARQEKEKKERDATEKAKVTEAIPEEPAEGSSDATKKDEENPSGKADKMDTD
ncbi:hypothetical protein V1527DRAFT_460954 [Lipomyces starkeyi]|uniref:VWFA domain-containing protein n=1 Tax=Lipomyces starkeyi NRRL Y-11557 TaxID=675824 RepID=A0A1E3PX03_LIPST|nr:hypothetical protein LIPSTDRAFT_107533 [Lipomyces starkeyi NRRL Y-11557]